MNNREMADKFEAVAQFLEIKGEAIYRVLAYRKAAEALRDLSRDVAVIREEGNLEDIPGVGKAIAAKIEEMIDSGNLGYYEELAAEIPPDLLEMLAVDGVGPKRAAQFWQEAGILSLTELEAAAREGRLRELSGMGVRLEQKILSSIEAYKHRQTDRFLLGQAWDTAQSLEERLSKVEGVEQIELAGSLRRYRETVGDLDIVAGTGAPGLLLDTFSTMPEVERILGKGDTKVSVELYSGLKVQLWAHPREHFGSALQYATGSQAHNVRLREFALRQGLSLSEHGFKTEEGELIECPREEDVYCELGLPWIPPEMREDRGEIEAAQEGALPELIRVEDLLGELHAHSTWSDGKASIAEMASAAKELGMKYLVISDHSQSLGVAGGLTAAELKQQKTEILEVQAEIGSGIELLQGSEVEILAGGGLDFDDEVLGSLDIVIASLHTALQQDRETATQRVLNAIENSFVHIIGHLTGRLIGKRDPADLDLERIFMAAVEHNVILEINAHPDRLDLKDTHARRALDLGCLLAINTDAHHPSHLGFRHFGVGTARRAWARPEQIVNTWSLASLREWLSSRRL
ncbi:MAG: DNA polymerase/3'-5' exonuclease PolX [Anaerolineales bacterium]|nr:DNA polymerase/3'-5' exonuclease PolX [Anaerolineales bacterium]